MSALQESSALVQVRDLKVHFPIRKGIMRRQVGAVRAVDGVSFDIFKGETLGLVGESGCGKSTTGLAILRLIDMTSGQVVFEDQDISTLPESQLRAMRRRMMMIFQDPYSSLNPRMTVNSIIIEPLNVFKIGEPRERAARVQELMSLVGLNPAFANRYPHECSGGQRQRIGIARALATNPSFIVGDEPISALDVSIQAQVVNLLSDLKQQLNLTYLFIGHDLSMVRYISNRVAVMYLGRVVELSNRDAIFDHPLHPYTRSLLSAVPIANPKRERARQRIILQGDVPSPAKPPSGCRFHPRCPFATQECSAIDPEMRNLAPADAAPHWVACHHAEKFV